MCWPGPNQSARFGLRRIASGCHPHPHHGIYKRMSRGVVECHSCPSLLSARCCRLVLSGLGLTVRPFAYLLRPSLPIRLLAPPSSPPPHLSMLTCFCLHPSTHCSRLRLLTLPKVLPSHLSGHAHSLDRCTSCQGGIASGAAPQNVLVAWSGNHARY